MIRLKWAIYDDLLNPITGIAATTKITLRRDADNFLYDWNDSTFKSSGWTTLTTQFSEIDATHLQGQYEKTFSEAAFDDGSYYAVADSTSSVVRHASAEFVVKAGVEQNQYILNSLVDLQDEAFGKWEFDHIAKTLKFYRRDNITLLKTFNLSDTTATVNAVLVRTPV